MPVPVRFWGIGIAAALLTHTAIVVLVFWQPPDSGARAVDPELAVPDSTPRNTTTARPVEDVAEAAPETVENRQVAPQAAAPEQPDAAEAPSTEAATLRQTTDNRQVEPEVAAAAQPDPAEAPPTEPVKTQPPETAVTASEPAQPRVEPVPNAEQAAPDATPTTSAASSPAGAGGTSGINVGSGESASAGGTPGPSADYMARLSAWLEKHKQYPRRAQRRRQEGTALLQFVIDREGRVIEYRIRESSGHEILDEEVAAMIERAQPLPGFPDDMPRARLELVVPIQFLLM